MSTRPSEIIFDRMKGFAEKEAICFYDKTLTYTEFLEEVDNWVSLLEEKKISTGSIVSLLGDFSCGTSTLIFALIKIGAIAVPLTDDVKHEIDSFKKIALVEHSFVFNNQDKWEYTLENTSDLKRNELIDSFKLREEAGLIVFTSGSTGKPKGILHSIEAVLNKFVAERKSWRTILFLLMDHFGGFNTFLSSFAYGGTAICPKTRSSENVAEVISMHKADLLPTTPTFLNLLFMGKYFENNDFSSIELITYGTEMMAKTTLENTIKMFPNAKLKQTYGMSEIGVLRSKSEADDSLWMKVGGKGFDIKIKENMLWVKSEANMIGYLNAPQPFDEEGWMCTGDEVEQKGEYIRFKGRKSEIINIGGKKVFPSEVESTILKASNIKDVTVFGKKHPLMGQVVYAKVTPIEPEEKKELTRRLRTFCNENLAKYKVPVKFEILEMNDEHHSKRYKKVRI